MLAHDTYPPSFSSDDNERSLNTLPVPMEASSFIPGTSSVRAIEVLKPSRITEAPRAATRGQIQLQFLVKRSGCAGREEEPAGGRAGYRSRMLLAYTSHRDGRV